VEFEDKVRAVIVLQLGVEIKRLTPEAKFVDDLGADSLDMIELLMAFEEKFALEISDEEAEGVLTVGEAIERLKKRYYPNEPKPEFKGRSMVLYKCPQCGYAAHSYPVKTAWCPDCDIPILGMD
jgi:acyl carrier protein